VVFDTTILGSNPSAPARLMKKDLSNNNLFRKIKKIIFPFYKSEEIKKLFKILEKDLPKDQNVAMFVGGCVRKFILDKEIDDIDIATILKPEEIKNKFKSEKEFRVVDTGSKHGTVTILINKSKFELTTLRKDIMTDGRHAKVEFTEDWKADSERRDFTINSIYLDKNGKIFDPQLGIQDLKNGVVKFIGDPGKRITEDYLRIIRFIRFALEYNNISLEPATFQAIKLNLNGIKKISKERILIELLKTIKLKNFKNIISNDQLKTIFANIFPELKYLDRLEKIKKIDYKFDNILMLSLLLIDNTNNYEYFCHKYNTSNEIKDGLTRLANLYESAKYDRNFFKKNLSKNIYLEGKKILNDLSVFLFLDSKKMKSKEFENQISDIEKIKVPKFPIDGSFLMKKGISEGKTIGSVLKNLEQEWLNNNYSLSEEHISSIIKKAKN
tara:strand:- start:2370 stop:3692 length:1323 start_codon:yes stop_codon:yes gene_type:complete